MSISLNNQILSVIPIPLDPKRTNCYVAGSSVVIETIAQYLLRVIPAIRDTHIVSMIIPKVGHEGEEGVYSITDFDTVLVNFDTKIYAFINGLNDGDFIEIISGINTGDQDLSGLEPVFSKNTGFNKNFGTTSGTVLEGRTFGTAANSAIGDFMQNQNAIAQSANAWIKGEIKITAPDADGNGQLFFGGKGFVGSLEGNTDAGANWWQIRNYAGNLRFGSDAYAPVQFYVNGITNTKLTLSVDNNVYVDKANFINTGTDVDGNGKIVLGAKASTGSIEGLYSDNSPSWQIRRYGNPLRFGTDNYTGLEFYTNGITNPRLSINEEGQSVFSGTVNSAGYLLNGNNLHSSLSTNAIAKWDGTKFIDGDVAPASGSGSYIQNQNASAQSANMWIDGNAKGNTLESTVATGTAPLTVASSTMVSNLNADLLDGQHGSYYQQLLTNPITGTGTSGYIPKFTGTTTQANSNIFDDGTNVGIGYSTGTEITNNKFAVNGSGYFGGTVNVVSTTPSTSTTTGALTVGGGLGVGGQVSAANAMFTTGAAANTIATGDASGNLSWSTLAAAGITTITSGSVSQVGAATTVFTVTIGTTQANTNYKVNVTPTSALSAALFYVTNKQTTTFDVTYLAGLTGTCTFDWVLVP